jgi:hypothetical protein
VQNIPENSEISGSSHQDNSVSEFYLKKIAEIGSTWRENFSMDDYYTPKNQSNHIQTQSNKTITSENTYSTIPMTRQASSWVTRQVPGGVVNGASVFYLPRWPIIGVDEGLFMRHHNWHPTYQNAEAIVSEQAVLSDTTRKFRVQNLEIDSKAILYFAALQRMGQTRPADTHLIGLGIALSLTRFSTYYNGDHNFVFPGLYFGDNAVTQRPAYDHEWDIFDAFAPNWDINLSEVSKNTDLRHRACAWMPLINVFQANGDDETLQALQARCSKCSIVSSTWYINNFDEMRNIRYRIDGEEADRYYAPLIIPISKYILKRPRHLAWWISLNMGFPAIHSGVKRDRVFFNGTENEPLDQGFCAEYPTADYVTWTNEKGRKRGWSEILLVLTNEIRDELLPITTPAINAGANVSWENADWARFYNRQQGRYNIPADFFQDLNDEIMFTITASAEGDVLAHMGTLQDLWVFWCSQCCTLQTQQETMNLATMLGFRIPQTRCTNAELKPITLQSYYAPMDQYFVGGTPEDAEVNISMFTGNWHSVSSVVGDVFEMANPDYVWLGRNVSTMVELPAYDPDVLFSYMMNFYVSGGETSMIWSMDTVFGEFLKSRTGEATAIIDYAYQSILGVDMSHYPGLNINEPFIYGFDDMASLIPQIVNSLCSHSDVIYFDGMWSNPYPFGLPGNIDLDFFDLYRGQFTRCPADWVLDDANIEVDEQIKEASTLTWLYRTELVQNRLWIITSNEYSSLEKEKLLRQLTNGVAGSVITSANVVINDPITYFFAKGALDLLEYNNYFPGTYKGTYELVPGLGDTAYYPTHTIPELNDWWGASVYFTPDIYQNWEYDIVRLHFAVGILSSNYHGKYLQNRTRPLQGHRTRTRTLKF